MTPMDRHALAKLIAYGESDQPALAAGPQPRLSDQDISAIGGVRKKRTALAKREASGGN